jgi:lysophospholipase L1-like esterase
MSCNLQINSISSKWLPLAADFILIHLGTNDCGQGHNATTMESDMNTLLATIKSGNPAATTIVASVINFGWNSMPAACATFNSGLPALVAAAKAGGQNVVFADVNKRSNWCNGPASGFPCTGVHPT